MAGKYYAVRKGRETGIYRSWDECKALVSGFAGAEYKSFKTLEEAEAYMGNNADNQMSFEELIATCKDNPDVLVAYVDGSFAEAHGAFSYGMIAFHMGEEIRECESSSDEDLVSMRNVAGEIMGSQAAMRLALERKCSEVHIFHDYTGISKWCLGEWKTNKNGTRAYKEYYDKVSSELNIIFHKVAGHSGDIYNDEADRLAKSALHL